MGIWKSQSNTEKQIRLSYSIKKAIAQLEKRRAQLEKQFRNKYIAAQEAKAAGDKEEAIRLLEECQLITDEQNDIKNEQPDEFHFMREQLDDFLYRASKISQSQ